MKLHLLLGFVFGLAACKGPSITVGDRLTFTESHKSRIVMVGASQAVKKQAAGLGLRVSGTHVLTLSGPVDKLSQLEIDAESLVLEDSQIHIDVPNSFEPDEEAYFLAKKDFGLIPFWKQNPLSDGRGVIVASIDDGVSPFHQGFHKTTENKRKYINRGSRGTAFSLVLEGNEDYFLAEEKQSREGNHWIDVNSNGERDRFLVRKHSQKQGFICIDLSLNGTIEESEECLRDFSSSGDFLYWDEARKLSLVLEYSEDTGALKFHQGEPRGDNHGEGVASVMAGHLIGGKFSGVAPGSQFVDYDIGAQVFDEAEGMYSIGGFLKALVWAGESGSQVANISYSMYYLSPKTQSFMAQAIDKVVRQYNMVVTFSAGNNGPGLGSMSRALVYPSSVLAVGAFASKELAENVHGVGGLPEHGQVIRYSSLGPAIDGGSGPHIIAPLNSAVHNNKGTGLRGFSGTSSASPAAAGFAAVMISHLSSLGLAIDAPTVVAAIRQSATMIPNTPYIAQGFGLPEIQKSIEIYKRMITAKSFSEVNIEVVNQQEDLVDKGLLILASSLKKNHEIKVRLRGKMSALVPEELQESIVQTVSIEYSEPWLQGPQRALLSQGSSYQHVWIDLEQLHDPQAGREYFGEIRYRSEDGQLLAVVPVTYIIDQELDQVFDTGTIHIPSESAVRRHIFIEPGTQGLFIKGNIKSGEALNLEISIVDGRGSEVGHASFHENQTIVPIKGHGWHQLVVERKGGTAMPYEVSVVMSSIRLGVVDQVIQNKQHKIILENQGNLALGLIELRPLAEVIDTYYKVEPIHNIASFKVPLLEHESLLLKVSSASTSLTRQGRSRCNVYIRNEAGDLLDHRSISSSKLIRLKEEMAGGYADVECYSFEYSYGLSESNVKNVWQLSVEKPASRDVFASGSLRIEPWEQREMTLSWDSEKDTETLSKLGVFFKSYIKNTQAILIAPLDFLAN